MAQVCKHANHYSSYYAWLQSRIHGSTSLALSGIRCWKWKWQSVIVSHHYMYISQELGDIWVTEPLASCVMSCPMTQHCRLWGTLCMYGVIGHTCTPQLSLKMWAVNEASWEHMDWLEMISPNIIYQSQLAGTWLWSAMGSTKMGLKASD